ncbi:hypothetical protein JOB18_039961 [Solea senegalensis]|uniref:Uncharacterized protein n=1 Tax=Solea senegalensis TaxID=28829 RepID=A0AAV6Q5E5_SOLSE|nr:hypothetical protein JOB18_039961 [Solea senegalensis]
MSKCSFKCCSYLTEYRGSKQLSHTHACTHRQLLPPPLLVLKLCVWNFTNTQSTMYSSNCES